jgi:hypothetical protein
MERERPYGGWLGFEVSHPSDKNKDVRWMGHPQFHLSWVVTAVGDQEETRWKGKGPMADGWALRFPTHRTKTKTSDGWGTRSFISRGPASPVED